MRFSAPTSTNPFKLPCPSIYLLRRPLNTYKIRPVLSSACLSAPKTPSHNASTLWCTCTAQHVAHNLEWGSDEWESGQWVVRGFANWLWIVSDTCMNHSGLLLLKQTKAIEWKCGICFSFHYIVLLLSWGSSIRWFCPRPVHQPLNQQTDIT